MCSHACCRTFFVETHKVREDKNLVNKLLQYGVTVYVAALFLSPALSVTAELFIYLIFFSSTNYRKALHYFLTTPIGKAFSFFVVTMLLGVIVGSIRDWIDWSILWSTRKVLILPIAAVIFMGNEGARERFIKGVLIVAVIVAAYGLTSVEIIELPRGARALAPFNGMLFAALLSVAIILLLRAIGLIQSTMTVLFVGLLLYALTLVGSRSAYLAFTVMICFVILVTLSPRHRELFGLKRVALITLSLLAWISVVLTSQISQQRIFQAVNEYRQPIDQGENTSIGQRKIFYLNTINMLTSYSIIGAGTASFEGAYIQHLKDKGEDESLVTRDPHNNYLKIWIEQGLVGLITLLWLLISLARNTFSSITSLMGGVVLLGWSISSLFNGHFGTFTEGRFFWAWTGVLLASVPSAHQPSLSDAKS